jgi:hypothetical protein
MQFSFKEKLLNIHMNELLFGIISLLNYLKWGSFIYNAGLHFSCEVLAPSTHVYLKLIYELQVENQQCQEYRTHTSDSTWRVNDVQAHALAEL